MLDSVPSPRFSSPQTRSRSSLRTTLSVAVGLSAALAGSLLAAPSVSLAQTYTTPDFVIDFTETYTPIWNDTGSGADEDVSIWRPVVPKGFVRLGHRIAAGYDEPSGQTMILRAVNKKVIKAPAKYVQIWNDAGSGALKTVFIWRASCAKGYSALGDVATSTKRAPSKSEISCVRSSDLAKAVGGDLLWDDTGSGATADFGAWSIDPPDSDGVSEFVSEGLFYGAATHTQPADNLIASLWAVKTPVGSDGGSAPANPAAPTTTKPNAAGTPTTIPVATTKPVAAGPATATPEWTAAVQQIVATAGKPPAAAPRSDRVTPLPVDYSPDGATKYINERHDETDNISDITKLGLNDSVIFPGALIKGDQVNSFIYPPITLKRAPIKVSVSAEGSSATGGNLSQTIQDPQSLSSSRQATADLLKTAIGPNTKLPARVDFSITEVKSEAQLALAFDADVKYGVGSVQSGFSFDKSKNLNHVVAKYKQIYFTVDVDTPRSPGDLFDPTTPISQITAAMPRGSNPLYVGTVTYGMMAAMFMESTNTAEEMKASLDAAYKGGVDVKVSSRYTAREVLNNSSLKIQVYGGSTAGLGSLETGIAGFLKVIAASRTYSADSPGVPISYVFRNLQDNLLTAVTQTAQYNLSTPIKVKQRVQVRIVNMICTMSDDEGSNNDADMDRWNFVVYAQNVRRGGALGPKAQENLYNFSTSGEVTTPVGYVWREAIGKTATVVFETDPAVWDFESEVLTIDGYGREYDSSGSNEEGTGTLPLKGSAMFGTHKFSVNSADFSYELTVEITKL